ncbi:SDR family NAD(P)-dependent oxidoreductase [uncultured Litoreibacter sp.]|uniref:SDR family NAD(P)-dependent oxidoreductase n=1 Tax=uncultured Litoreibacter sp. TaxID=1392394 RepID=UPI002637A8D2|nr:SDR family NAD(P)-dependent oxidoreductase [uncultured Litoreibacter sp.]
MNTYDMTGRVAVVTGGAQGIGLAVTQRLQASGAKVAVWDMQDATSGDFNTKCDIADMASVTEALAASVAALGPVDILVNSAGVAGPNAPVTEYDDDAWAQIIAINLTGTYNTIKAVLPSMQARNYGRILNIASIAGKEGNPNACAYSASKAGVIGFTKSAGKENAGQNIAVNCITPAAARTPIFDQMSEEHIGYMLSKIPRDRFLEVEEVANMVAWIVSAENSFTTGAVFDLSGGRATY